MRIRSVRVGVLETPLRTPFKTAVRSVDRIVDVVVCLETEEGLVGWGSAPPTDRVTGETVASLRGALEEILGPAVMGREGEDLEDNLDRVEGALMGNSSAKAALDIALHDLWARSMGQPLWRLLGGAGAAVETDVTVSLNDPEEMGRDAREAAEAGFRAVKIKVGRGGEEDVARLRSVRRAVGAEVALRIDANQGWRPKEAVEVLNKLEREGLDIELVEQPVPSWDLEGMAYVRQRTLIPLAADESVHTPRDAEVVLGRGAADLVNIKLMKCGGLRNALRILAVSESHGAEAMLGSMLEGKVSIAAAVHLASARRGITRTDLDGPLLGARDSVQGGPLYEGGQIRPGEGAGTGIRGVEGIRWFGER